MVRRACYDKAGRWTDAYGGGADRELWLRILRDWDLGYINEPMASLRNRIRELPADPIRRHEWAAEQWRQMGGQVTIQRLHFESDLKSAPLRLAQERVRLKAQAVYELWRWGLLMLAKGGGLLSEPGPEAFRSAGMTLSASIYDTMQSSHMMQQGLRRLHGVYRYAAGQ